MHHEPGNTDPTTHLEPRDVEAHVNISGRPPIVDDVQAHTIKGHGPAEADEPAADVDAHTTRWGEPADGDE